MIPEACECLRLPTHSSLTDLKQQSPRHDTTQSCFLSLSPSAKIKSAKKNLPIYSRVHNHGFGQTSVIRYAVESRASVGRYAVAVLRDCETNIRRSDTHCIYGLGREL